MNRTLLAAAVLLTACKPPEAPDTIEEMMVYGFANFDEDPEYIVALADNLIPWMEENREALGEGYEINDLTTEHLVAAGIEDREVDGVVGAAAGLYYTASMDELAFGLSYAEQAEIFEAYLEFDRLRETEQGCFLDHSCPTHDSLAEVHANLGAGIEMWNEFEQVLRWVDGGDWGRLMLVRITGPTPVEFSVDWLEVPQQYSFSFVYPDADGAATRVQAIWVEGRVIGADVPETFALTLGINNMVNSAADLDAWLAAR
ncbi:MAG: hypothetical protein H6739_17805 [Alphaproteobacteria bacterium]|nr:hypothetical protein [Alphaproteobacteria bacterium]